MAENGMTQAPVPFPLIPVIQMPQQNEVHAADDDWSGVIDPVRRRKLQNRINQRIYRQRSQVKTIAHLRFASKDPKSSGREYHTRGDSKIENAIIKLSGDPDISIRTTGPLYSCPGDAESMQASLEAFFLKSYVQGSPDIDHLLTLTRLNVQRAAKDNIVALGMTADWMKDDDAVSIFNMLCPGYSEERIPPSLRPTALQRVLPHHPWFDIFPFPQIRDNLISADTTGSFDDVDLCHDLMAFWDTRNTSATLLVWGFPWDPENWEITDQFLRKWGWVVTGCPDIFISTNRWRARRGEKPLC